MGERSITSLGARGRALFRVLPNRSAGTPTSDSHPISSCPRRRYAPAALTIPVQRDGQGFTVKGEARARGSRAGLGTPSTGG